MDTFSTAVVAAWVLCCLAIVGLAVPAAALGPARHKDRQVPDFGPALVWTWATAALVVPAAVAVHGFNWATSLLLSFAWPAALWVMRHRGRCRISFMQGVRALVFRVVAPEPGPRWPSLNAGTAVVIGLPLIPVILFAAGRTEMRLPVPADFDTLWRSRQLLQGTPIWDPLASLSAVLTHVSAADALSVVGASRLALVALTAGAAALLVTEVCDRRIAVLMPPVVVVFAPWAPAVTWAVLLLAIIGTTSLWVWGRDHRSTDGWHAVAAFGLAVGQIVAMPDPSVLLNVSGTARFLEHRAAPVEALRLARLPPDSDWVLVGPPEQQLETDGRGGYYDLSRFVSRFRDRAGDGRFRFDLGTRRLFVFVEKAPVDVSRPVRGVRFVEAQPAAYRVPSERARLARLAKQICDDYRRTHTGAEIVYDDDVLRVYRIDT